MRRTLAVLAWLILVAALVAALGGCGAIAHSTSTLATPTAAGVTPGITTLPEVDPVSGLPFVALADLPPAASDAVARIDKGGPFVHEQDGAEFQNREGILPDRPGGYYREYTVETPGSNDRGARRIVAGGDGELYWTADHYVSFARIRR